MAPIRRLADVIIDTSKFNVHELRQFIIDRFQNPGRRPLLVSVVSFGFRYGIPADADLVFDVRFLAQSAFRPAPAEIQRQRSARRALHPLFLANGRIPPPHRELVVVLDPALYSPKAKAISLLRSVAPAGGIVRWHWPKSFVATLKRKGYSAKVVHRDIDKVH